MKGQGIKQHSKEAVESLFASIKELKDEKDTAGMAKVKTYVDELQQMQSKLTEINKQILKVKEMEQEWGDKLCEPVEIDFQGIDFILSLVIKNNFIKISEWLLFAVGIPKLNRTNVPAQIINQNRKEMYEQWHRYLFTETSQPHRYYSFYFDAICVALENRDVYFIRRLVEVGAFEKYPMAMINPSLQSYLYPFGCTSSAAPLFKAIFEPEKTEQGQVVKIKDTVQTQPSDTKDKISETKSTQQSIKTKYLVDVLLKNPLCEADKPLLIVAARAGDFEAVKYLIRLGANYNLEEVGNESAEEYASRNTTAICSEVTIKASEGAKLQSNLKEALIFVALFKEEKARIKQQIQDALNQKAPEVKEVGLTDGIMTQAFDQSNLGRYIAEQELNFQQGKLQGTLLITPAMIIAQLRVCRQVLNNFVYGNRCYIRDFTNPHRLDIFSICKLLLEIVYDQKCKELLCKLMEVPDRKMSFEAAHLAFLDKLRYESAHQLPQSVERLINQHNKLMMLKM